MAWYTSHHLRYRGRLVSVTSRYGSFSEATVVKGKPLKLREGSRDWKRLARLFYRSKKVACEIQDFQDALDRHYS